jgi:hypothetical protein
LKIKVDDTNRFKLQEALDRVNGDAYAHVASTADVIAVAARAEASLDDCSVPLRERRGWCDKGPAAKSYGYKRNQTSLTLLRGAGHHWFLTRAARVGGHPRQSEQYRITISAAQRDRIIKTALADFEVRD